MELICGIRTYRWFIILTESCYWTIIEKHIHVSETEYGLVNCCSRLFTCTKHKSRWDQVAVIERHSFDVLLCIFNHFCFSFKIRCVDDALLRWTVDKIWSTNYGIHEKYGSTRFDDRYKTTFSRNRQWTDASVMW